MAENNILKLETAGKRKSKIIVDIAMSVILLFLMAYQVTGGKYHEWLGAAMLVLFIVHNIFNYRWYKTLFKGKYTAVRLLRVIVNIITLVSIILTGYSGIVMSSYVFTFITFSKGIMTARKLHLAFSYLAFVFMSIHLGLHWGMVVSKFKIKNNAVIWIMRVLAAAAAVYGAYLFGKAHIFSYISMKSIFVMFDYSKSAMLVLLENIFMMSMWVFVGYYVNKALIRKKNIVYIIAPVVVIIICIIFGMPAKKNSPDNGAGGWGAQSETPSKKESVGETAVNKDNITDVNDGFVLINGGTFNMGSPESEDWRVNDETIHEVTVSPFYMSAYELTQKEYADITGENPSTFSGDNLPVENVSWLDAVKFCNSLSEKNGLQPVYEISDTIVSWNRSANGYRLPTEAEWEYACRAGTQTPFNTQTSISSKEADYYGYYPYNIEENYFDQENLETKPGEYRQTTVAVDSFSPNAWGLYNMHGNVSEWVWDYYGEYDLTDNVNPAGAETGTLRVYRGGGWNDFAKNLRSAYRGTLEQDMSSFNIGIRLVRNAVSDVTGVVGNTGKASTLVNRSGEKMLIVYFSWGGNTRSIAKQIQQQTGADIFELTLKTPYSTDYNTVLKQSQNDQNIQARPELNAMPENLESYDLIMLGYPNWWASIPMPVATFLENSNLSGKTIIPFCSHGGGRFGQSLTAIAKLAPDAVMGEPLSIHYGGGSTLSSDIAGWLEKNGL